MVELWSCFSCGKPFVGEGDKCKLCADAARAKRPRLSAVLSSAAPARLSHVQTSQTIMEETATVDRSAVLIDLTCTIDQTTDEAPASCAPFSGGDQVQFSAQIDPASSYIESSNDKSFSDCILGSTNSIVVESSKLIRGCADKCNNRGVGVQELDDGGDGGDDRHGGGVDDGDNDDGQDMQCLVCGKDLDGLGAADRDTHVRQCCRRAGLLSPVPQSASLSSSECRSQANAENGKDVTESAVSLDFGGGPLDSAELYCVVCGRDISGWGIYYRCMHIKRCARSQGLSVRAVLRLILPFDDLANEVPRSDEQGGPDEQRGDDAWDASVGGDGRPGATGKARADINSVLMHATRTAAILKATTGEKSSGSLIPNNNATGSAICATSASGSVPTAPSANINYVLMTAARQRALARLGDAAPVDAAVSIPGRGVASSKGRASSRPGGTRKAIAASSSSLSGNVSSGLDQLQPQQPAGGSRGAGKGVGGRNSGRGRFGQQRGEAADSGVSYAPEYKKVYCLSSAPGSHSTGGSSMLPIIVDGFVFASRGLSDTYVLTHFHSDHYDGLRKSFDCGRILCSPTTAALVRLRLGVPGSRLVPLALETKHSLTLSGGQQVDVTLVDANHCPGAVCVLFEFRSGKRVFHTGDFRFDAAAMLPRSPTLRRLLSLASSSGGANSGLVVYLDTTYCDERYDFPRQEDAIRAVVDTVRHELRSSNAAGLRTLFVFGAYGIGKERVFMAVAEALDTCVYVDPSRWRAMMCYDDWPVDVKARRLTKDPARAAAAPATLWVAPMGQINAKGLRTLLTRANGGRGMQAEDSEDGGASAHTDVVDSSARGSTDAEGAKVGSKAQGHLLSSRTEPASIIGTAATHASVDNNRPFHRVVAFQPTGWSQVPSKGSESVAGATDSPVQINMTARRYRLTSSGPVSRGGSSSKGGRGGGRAGRGRGATDVAPSLGDQNDAGKHAAAGGATYGGCMSSDGMVRAEADVAVAPNEVVVYSVPYSEHSSFGELVHFVRMFKPQRIVPTVNPRAEAARAQVELLKKHALTPPSLLGGDVDLGDSDAAEGSMNIISGSSFRNVEDAGGRFATEHHEIVSDDLFLYDHHGNIGDNEDFYDYDIGGGSRYEYGGSRTRAGAIDTGGDEGQDNDDDDDDNNEGLGEEEGGEGVEASVYDGFYDPLG